MSENTSNAANDARSITVNGQYVKDLSFENPKAPGVLFGEKARPEISVSVDVNAQKMNEENYEITLGINAKALQDGETIFIAELSYAGLFTATNIPENELEAALLVYCPGLLFPFARRVLSDITRDGGFPPLMLDPVDFGRLYAHNKTRQMQEKGNVEANGTQQ